MRGISPLRGCLGAAVVLAAATAAGDVTAAPKALLPNLVPLRSQAILVGGPARADDRDPTVLACHPHEVANDQPAPRRCLRFETHAANTGRGPLELRHRADELVAQSRVLQRVYRSDGTFQDGSAGSFVLDPAHGHFHYEDFAVAYLWRSDARGRKLGRTPIRRGSKAGFCLMDGYAYRAGPPARYSSPHACYPTHVGEGGEVAQVSGISPGWVDVYDVSVAHQYIEVSGVPDGYYLLQIVLDPHRRLRETTRVDNEVWHRVRLCGDDADLVGRTTNCGRS